MGSRGCLLSPARILSPNPSCELYYSLCCFPYRGRQCSSQRGLCWLCWGLVSSVLHVQAARHRQSLQRDGVVAEAPRAAERGARPFLCAAAVEPRAAHEGKDAFFGGWPECARGHVVTNFDYLCVYVSQSRVLSI